MWIRCHLFQIEFILSIQPASSLSLGSHVALGVRECGSTMCLDIVIDEVICRFQLEGLLFVGTFVFVPQYLPFYYIYIFTIFMELCVFIYLVLIYKVLFYLPIIVYTWLSITRIFLSYLSIFIYLQYLSIWLSVIPDIPKLFIYCIVYG